MNPHVKSITITEFDGTFNETIEFLPGLNIISGENGTGKTTVIRRIKEYAISNNTHIAIEATESVQSPAQLQIFALSPKRNSEKRTIESTVSTLRSQNRSIQSFFNDIRSHTIDDATFKKYESFGELFVLYFEERKKDGGNQVEKMKEVASEFNQVLVKIFPEYSLESKWNPDIGGPELKLKVGTRPGLSLEKLSLGQQEVLSLIFNIYTSKERNHVYLVDEPEIHLNWNLEKGLFEFFDWFCQTYNKQVIVVTHSRVIFKTQFYGKCCFLVWDNNKLIVSRTVTDAQRESIAGEIAATINIVAPTSKTFFVEDKMHELVLTTLAQLLKKNISVIQCGNSPNVKSFFELSKDQSSAWRENGYYLIDGDNQGSPYPGEERFIHLSKYSIDSFFFDLNLLEKLLGRSQQDIQNAILGIIKRKKALLFSKGKSAKFGEALIDKLTPDFITTESLGLLDCSELIETFCSEVVGKRKEEFITTYIDLALQIGVLENVFDKKLIQSI